MPEQEKERGEHVTLLKEGQFKHTHRDKNGKIISIRHIENTKLDAGKKATAQHLGGIINKPFKYLQIGTGTTAAKVTNTALENFLDEALATVTYEDDYKFIISHTFTASGHVEITEDAVANDERANSPALLCRTVYAAEVLEIGETLEVQYSAAVE